MIDEKQLQIDREILFDDITSVIKKFEEKYPDLMVKVVRTIEKVYVSDCMPPIIIPSLNIDILLK